MLIALLTFALAGPPEATVLPTQGVEGTVSVTLSPGLALTHLANPAWVREVSGSSTTVVVRPGEGRCVLADYVSPSSLMTVRYTLRQCPSGNGLRATLVSSDDLVFYESEWLVEAEGTGSLLRYRVHVRPKLPIPLGLMMGTMRRDVLGMMEGFGRQFGVPSP